MFQHEDLVPEMKNLGKFAMRLTRNASDAQDLTQATVLRALEKKDLFQEGTKLFSWLSKIMFNIFASQYRHSRKFGTQYDPEPYINSVAVMPDQEVHVDLVTVGECMKRLSNDHREVLVLTCVRGLSYEEASVIMNVPLGTIRSRLSRARLQLQELLAPPADRMQLLDPASVVRGIQKSDAVL